MKIAYIGIDLLFSALEGLERAGCEIVEIFTCRTDNKTEFNVKICEFAKERGIPCQTERISREDIDRLLKKGCDMAVCGGYYYKIPWDTPLPIVNIHPTLLPIGRGSWPMPRIILQGHEKSGVTLHKIAEGFDSGDILLQREFFLDREETHKSYMEKVSGVLPDMMRELSENFSQLFERAVPQPEGEYWQLPQKGDYTVSYKMSVSEADAVLRAFFGYECIYEGENSAYEIIGARAVEGSPEGKELPLSDGYIEWETKSLI